MAWRRPTRDDLTARLSDDEQSAFSASSGFSPDVVEGVIAQATAFARDAIRSGARARLSPEDGSLPEGLLRPVMAIAVLDILNRFSIPPSDASSQRGVSTGRTTGDACILQLPPDFCTLISGFRGTSIVFSLG